MLRIVFCAVLSLLSAGTLRAELRLAPLFTDGAVLQRDKPIPVWGWADAGQTVKVSFHDGAAAAVAGADGRWQVSLPAAKASAESSQLTVESGGKTVAVRDVVVGEVWLCSGQSNMEWHVSQADNADAEMAAANFPLIRHYRVPHVAAEKPADEFESSKWVAATPKSVRLFTAVGYFFARDIHRELNVPIGLINASWGGKMIEVFMSLDLLASRPEFAKVDKRWQQEQEALPEKLKVYQPKLAEWEAAKAAATAAGTAFKTPKPTDPALVVEQHRPGCLFNGMINPIIPYGIRGALWYQGEHNIARPEEYLLQFTSMITDWRARSGQGDFPFYFVQLSSFDATLDKTRTGYARLREAQMLAQDLPNTGMAVTIDIGTPENVHPRNKQDVGARLARIAKEKTYGIHVEWSGPVLQSAQRETNGVRLSFDHADGLVLRAATTSSFEVAGADEKFSPVAARVEGKSVVLNVPAGSDVATVRYAWANAPQASLFNGEGLPASPFRYTLSSK